MSLRFEYFEWHIRMCAAVHPERLHVNLSLDNTIADSLCLVAVSLGHRFVAATALAALVVTTQNLALSLAQNRPQKGILQLNIHTMNIQSHDKGLRSPDYAQCPCLW